MFCKTFSPALSIKRAEVPRLRSRLPSLTFPSFSFRFQNLNSTVTILLLFITRSPSKRKSNPSNFHSGGTAPSLISYII